MGASVEILRRHERRAGKRDRKLAGKLLNDPRLYDNLQRLVARIDSIAADLQKNPRRYINLEIF